MKIAVVQHRLRGEPYEDAAALVESARQAQDAGALLIFFPEVESLGEDFGGPRAEFLSQLRSLDVSTLAPNPATRADGEDVSFVELGPLGRAALLAGDAPLDSEVHKSLLGAAPDMVVMLGNSESDLQAEALVELAIGLSESLASLVIVVDAVGAEPGRPGHGGSAVALLGEIVAEALGEDEVIVADVPAPPPGLHPREGLPAVPPILIQRSAFHRGVKPSVEYPADLS